MERLQRELRALLRFVVASQLQHHQLANCVHEIRGVERSPLRLASRRRLLQECFVAEEPHPLFDREVFAVQTDADDTAGQADERFSKLPEFDGGVAAAETRLDHHLLAVVRPPLDERRRGEERRLAHLRLDLTEMLVMQEMTRIHLVD